MQSVATTLEHAIDYVYRQAQHARNCDEHEDFSITLRLLGLLNDGWSGVGIVDLACGYAVGLPHAKFLYRRAQRAAFMRKELLGSIPDYDYSRDISIKILGEQAPKEVDGRRRY